MDKVTENDNITKKRSLLRENNAETEGSKEVPDKKVKTFIIKYPGLKQYNLKTPPKVSINKNALFRLDGKWSDITNVPKTNIKITLKSIVTWFKNLNVLENLKIGRNMGFEGFVQSILCMQNASKEVISYKCSCKAEKTENTFYKVHILQNNANMFKTFCTCAAGGGPSAVCKHVAACFIAIEFYAQTGKSLNTVSPTSEQQTTLHHSSPKAFETEDDNFDTFMGYNKTSLMNIEKKDGDDFDTFMGYNKASLKRVYCVRNKRDEFQNLFMNTK